MTGTVAAFEFGFHNNRMGEPAFSMASCRFGGDMGLLSAVTLDPPVLVLSFQVPHAPLAGLRWCVLTRTVHRAFPS
jgi:hypothetical protein